MTYKLFDATLDLARILTNVWESTATGGTVSTCIDTGLYQTDGWFSDTPPGTLWLKDPATFHTVTAHAGTTLTFSPAAAAAVQAGDDYAAAPGVFPLHLLIQAVNSALREAPLQDTSLVTVAEQEAYSLPAGVMHLQRVEIARETSAPYRYQVHYNWYEFEEQLVFDDGHIPEDDGWKMRLTYLPERAALKAASDEISTYVHPERIRWAAAVHALRWKVQQTQDQDTLRLLNEALQNAIQQAGMYPIPRTQPDPHHARW